MLPLMENTLLSHCSSCLARRMNYSVIDHLSSRGFFSSVKRPDKRTHYEILGVTKNASTSEIKSAFFKQSKKLHPDKNPGDPHTHEKFVTLNRAYSVLSKASSRKEYDVGLHYQKNLSQQYPFYRNKYQGSADSDDMYRYGEYSGYADRNSYKHFHAPNRGPANKMNGVFFCIGLLGIGVIYFMVALIEDNLEQMDVDIQGELEEGRNRWSKRIRDRMTAQEIQFAKQYDQTPLRSGHFVKRRLMDRHLGYLQQRKQHAMEIERNNRPPSQSEELEYPKIQEEFKMSESNFTGQFKK